jgi:arylsulfatase A-like enzyme
MTRENQWFRAACAAVRRSWPACTAALLLSACGTGRAAGGASANTRPAQPDIVVILTDDAGYADFGFTGATDGMTPAIDALAALGVVCTQAYTTASVCSPSRAGMLSGRYQQRVGHEFNANQLRDDGTGWGFPAGESLLPELLAPAGYRTVYLGKWHLGAMPEHHPNANGVDEFTGLIDGSRSYRAMPNAGALKRLQRNGVAIDESPEAMSGLYLTDFLSDEAVRALESPRTQPLLLFVSYTAPHTPMHARDPALAVRDGDGPAHERRRAVEREMIRAVDEGVARILGAIKPGTLVFLTNDNGGATNNGSDNGALRGMKGSKWEGGIRVPFIARWDGVLEPGTTYAKPISLMDITATACAAAGAPAAPKELDGVDLLPFLTGARGDATPHEWLFWRRGVVSAARHGDWKFIRSAGNPDILVDLASDPGETVNRAGDEPDRAAAMAAALDLWERDMVPPGNAEAEVYRRNQISKHRMETVGRDAERALP